MPYKFQTDKTLIPKEHDKRVKLTDEQREEIKEMYSTGLYSQRDLAKLFQVSRRLIIFIIHPERKEENYRKRVENGGSKQYYDKEKHREYMKTHRHHKKQLADKGQLIERKGDDNVHVSK